MGSEACPNAFKHTSPRMYNVLLRNSKPTTMITVFASSQRQAPLSLLIETTFCLELFQGTPYLPIEYNSTALLFTLSDKIRPNTYLFRTQPEIIRSSAPRFLKIISAMRGIPLCHQIFRPVGSGILVPDSRERDVLDSHSSTVVGASPTFPIIFSFEGKTSHVVHSKHHLSTSPSALSSSLSTAYSPWDTNKLKLAFPLFLIS